VQIRKRETGAPKKQESKGRKIEKAQIGLIEAKVRINKTIQHKSPQNSYK
jgi:hypothetical protein